MDDLNARATAVFRWVPGMLIRTTGGPTDRIAGIDETYIHAWAESQQDTCPRGIWVRYRIDRMDRHGVMETSDPQTRGAMLEQVREAWGDETITPMVVEVDPNEFDWVLVGATLDAIHPLDCLQAPTEAEALVAAMGAASQPTE